MSNTPELSAASPASPLLDALVQAALQLQEHHEMLPKELAKSLADGMLVAGAILIYRQTESAAQAGAAMDAASGKGSEVVQPARRDL